jgi:hypothetical protein
MSDPTLIADLARAGIEPELLQRVAMELARARVRPWRTRSEFRRFSIASTATCARASSIATRCSNFTEAEHEPGPMPMAAE